MTRWDERWPVAWRQLFFPQLYPRTGLVSPRVLMEGLMYDPLCIIPNPCGSQAPGSFRHGLPIRRYQIR
jgi:hypothetical protein